MRKSLVLYIGNVLHNSVFSTARVMLPDDANPMGNVHGGNTLQNIELAGWVAAARHCQLKNNEGPIWPALAHLTQTSFKYPMFVGNLAKFIAKPIFTSDHSIDIMVEAWAEDVTTGQQRSTNTAFLTYVALGAFGSSVRKVPRLEPTTEDEARLFKEFEVKYRERKILRSQGNKDASTGYQYYQGLTPNLTLSQVMLPSDSFQGRLVTGGSIMKLMDTAASYAAAKHCLANCVTANIDNLDMISAVSVGDIVFVEAFPVFASSRSMDVIVRVEVERIGHAKRFEATSGRFTFVALGPSGPLPIPPLVPKNKQQEQTIELNRQLYEANKSKRNTSQH